MMDVLTVVWLGKPLWMWLGFHVLIACLLAFDLGLLLRQHEHVGVQQQLEQHQQRSRRRLLTPT